MTPHSWRMRTVNLSETQRSEIEQALKSDSALRERVDAHRRLRASLAGAFDGVLVEPLPASLSAAVNTSAPAAGVVDLNARRRARAAWSVREWGAVAASLIGGVILGVGAMNAQPSPIAVTADGMSARGALESALNMQLASDEARAVHIGLSFRAQGGGYCRTFELRARETAGIACRNNDGWTVAMLAAQAAQGEVRMASAPETILNAVDAMIDGEPLDAEAEAEARDAGWRTEPR